MSGNVTPVEDITQPIEPSCKILCFCQGATEMCLRFIFIVLFLVVLIVASVSRDRIDDVDDFEPFDSDRDKYAAASGWMIFVSVMGIVTETFIVIARFLNFSVVNRNFSLIGVMDVVTSFVFMGCMFAGWVPNAEYSGDVKDVREDCEAYNATLVGNHCDQLKDVESAQAATAIFGALGMLASLLLAVYMSLFILKKWNFYVLTGHSTLYGNAPQQEENTPHEQEKQHLL